MNDNPMGGCSTEAASMYAWIIGNGVHQVTELMIQEEEEGHESNF